jgi:hypothetical protein
MTEQQIEIALDELVSLTTTGNWEIAFEKFYHEDLVKTDLDGTPIQGKVQNLSIGKAFSAKISNVRDFSCSGKIVKSNRSFLAWSLDFDVDNQPFKVAEVAIQDWQDGRIIQERFVA